MKVVIVRLFVGKYCHL